jgi:hypothetical protein
MGHWLRHLSFANVVSVVALFVALGGGSYAALSGDDSAPAKTASDQSKRADREAGGPPPWAPAHGWRCKQAGNRPGSPDFRACIKERKTQQR